MMKGQAPEAHACAISSPTGTAGNTTRRRSGCEAGFNSPHRAALGEPRAAQRIRYCTIITATQLTMAMPKIAARVP